MLRYEVTVRRVLTEVHTLCTQREDQAEELALAPRLFAPTHVIDTTESNAFVQKVQVIE